MDVVMDWCECSKMRLSESKCVYIMMKGKLSRDPTVKIGCRNIKRNRQVKYLGVILDDIGNFTEHVKHIVAKGKIIFHGLKKMSRRNWDINTASLRAIYWGAVVPIVTYGVSVWCEKVNHSHNKRSLGSLNALCAKVIGNMYMSVANEAAEVLARVPPLDLTILERKAIEDIKRSGSASLLDSEYRSMGSFRELKNTLRMAIMSEWQRRWNISTSGHITRQFIPDIGEFMEPWTHLDYVVMETLTGHGEFGRHLKRLGKRDSSDCVVCGLEDEPIHRIFTCPMYEDERRLVEQRMIGMEMNPRQVLYRLIETNETYLLKAFADDKTVLLNV